MLLECIHNFILELRIYYIFGSIKNNFLFWMGISHFLNIVKKKKSMAKSNCWHFPHGILPTTCYEATNFSWCLKNHLYYPELTSVTSVYAFKFSFLD